jgi:hypothetical protein
MPLMRKPYLGLSFEGMPNIPNPWQMQDLGWAMIIGSWEMFPPLTGKENEKMKMN